MKTGALDGRSRWFVDFWRTFGRNKAGVFGVSIFGGILFLALAAPLLSAHGPFEIGVGGSLSPPSSRFPMGTDELGRDFFSRFLWGGRISLTVGLSAGLTSALVGVVVGMTAGFFGGLADDVLMRATEVFQTIPSFFLALVIVAFFGSSILNIIIAIAILSWPQTARLVRSEFLSLKSRPFVDAAKVLGASNFTIIVREMLPNVMGIVAVSATLLSGQAILLEAALSYLGLGDPNVVTWGQLLFESEAYIQNSWWLSIFPGVAIFLTVLSTNLIGESLAEFFKPKQKER